MKGQAETLVAYLLDSGPDSVGFLDRMKRFLIGEVKTALVAAKTLAEVRSLASASGKEMTGSAVSGMTASARLALLTRHDPQTANGISPASTAKAIEELLNGERDPRPVPQWDSLSLEGLRSLDGKAAGQLLDASNPAGKARRLALIRRIEPGFEVTGNAAARDASIKNRLKQLAAGEDPVLPLPSDIEALRAWSNERGRDHLIKDLNARAQADVLACLRSIDKHYPPCDKERAVERIARISDGGPLANPIDLARDDLETLRKLTDIHGKAYAEDAVRPLPVSKLRNLLKRLDPAWPDVRGISQPDAFEAVVGLCLRGVTSAERDAPRDVADTTASSFAYPEGEHPYAERWKK